MGEDKDNLNTLSGGFENFLLLGVTWQVDSKCMWIYQKPRITSIVWGEKKKLDIYSTQYQDFIIKL